MRISYRLYAAVVPAVLGVILVAALSYWGQYARSAPAAVLLVAAIAAVASLVVAWRNTRYVIRRVEALAAAGAGSTGADEIDAIGRRITSLGAEAASARADASRTADEARRRASELATLIAEIASGSRERVEEARMPVHILLATQFGELNENQEEMLGAADSAMTALDEELAKLRTIADIDRGALTLSPESVRVDDVLRSLHPMLRAQAEKERVQLTFDVEPVLPRVMADATRLRDALRLAITDDIRYAVPGSTVAVEARSTPDAVTVTVNHASQHSDAGNVLLAARLLSVQGGTLEHGSGRTVITLPRVPGRPAG